MKTLLIAASALAFASPALAQMGASPATTTPSSTTTAPATTDAMSTTYADDTTTSTTVTTPMDPKALIASEFPTYDKDGNGMLDKAEFATWMEALKAKSGQPPLRASSV